jgi:hypothetical protein
MQKICLEILKDLHALSSPEYEEMAFWMLFWLYVHFTNASKDKSIQIQYLKC